MRLKREPVSEPLQAVQALTTHWAYYFFLSRLLASGLPPSTVEYLSSIFIS